MDWVSRVSQQRQYCSNFKTKKTILLLVSFPKSQKKQASLIKFEGVELCYFFKAMVFNESVININSEADLNILYLLKDILLEFSKS